MFELLLEARELYLQDVILNGKRYDRYVDDFINSHRYINCNSAICRNCHEMNIQSPEKFYDNIEHHYEFLGDKLIIGKFCAIAAGVKFIMNGANHRMDGITTYPFNIFGCGWEKVTPTIEQLPFKGDTVIGNDVWICQNVTIMPGVKIGDGAIIAANSTVVKSVEPYSIYGGNPAKFIKKRFSDEKIEFLLKLEWWNWSEEEIFDNLEILTSEAGLEELMNKYSKRDEIN